MDDGNDSLIAPRRFSLSSGIIIGPSTKVNTHTSQVSFVAIRKRKWIPICRETMNGKQMRSFPGKRGPLRFERHANDLADIDRTFFPSLDTDVGVFTCCSVG